jgi:hypothetical protein
VKSAAFRGLLGVCSTWNILVQPRMFHVEHRWPGAAGRPCSTWNVVVRRLSGDVPGACGRASGGTFHVEHRHPRPPAPNRGPGPRGNVNQIYTMFLLFLVYAGPAATRSALPYGLAAQGRSRRSITEHTETQRHGGRQLKQGWTQMNTDKRGAA